MRKPGVPKKETPIAPINLPGELAMLAHPGRKSSIVGSILVRFGRFLARFDVFLACQGLGIFSYFYYKFIFSHFSNRQ
jgi:hypothetical protein